MKTINKVKSKIDKYSKITIITHINPDADTLGTALGIYALLVLDRTKKIEVVCASVHLPIHLDFLPNYKKIKHKIDYSDSLIISCDCGSIDRLGFDIEGRDIINIDHHNSNTLYGNINIIESSYASASQVAFGLFKEIYSINLDSAVCFYSALLSDSRYFTSTYMTKEVFEVAKELVEIGVQPNEVASNFTQRQSLASVRILQRVLGSLSLYKSAKVSILYVTLDDMIDTGALVADIEGIVDYGISLVSVDIAIFIIEEDTTRRISLRSKKVDISPLAISFGGGGHKNASGFSVPKSILQETIDTILEKIEELGLINEI